MNRRSFFLSLLAGVAGSKAVKAGAVSLPVTATERMLPMVVGEVGTFGSPLPAAASLQAELMAITRKAFVPKMAVQIYNQSPLRSLMGETVTLSLPPAGGNFDWGDYADDFWEDEE